MADMASKLEGTGLRKKHRLLSQLSVLVQVHIKNYKTFLLLPSHWPVVSTYLAVQKKVVWFYVPMDKTQLMNRING